MSSITSTIPTFVGGKGLAAHAAKHRREFVDMANRPSWESALWALLLVSTVGVELTLVIALLGYPVYHFVMQRRR